MDTIRRIRFGYMHADGCNSRKRGECFGKIGNCVFRIRNCWYLGIFRRIGRLSISNRIKRNQSCWYSMHIVGVSSIVGIFTIGSNLCCANFGSNKYTFARYCLF